MNTIKIVVGDVGDNALDSWVLLESGTFSCESPAGSKSSKNGYSSKSSKGTSTSTKSAKYAFDSSLQAQEQEQEMKSSASASSVFRKRVRGHWDP
eukprot:scaffold9439_cov72-Skeletonema_dohrnii-CCMP3373.AAC.2